jgi:hypothetical protein
MFAPPDSFLGPGWQLTVGRGGALGATRGGGEGRWEVVGICRRWLAQFSSLNIAVGMQPGVCFEAETNVFTSQGLVFLSENNCRKNRFILTGTNILRQKVSFRAQSKPFGKRLFQTPQFESNSNTASFKP